MTKPELTDYFGADASKLLQTRLFLFDMDGTIYTEETLFDGTLELLSIIRSIGGRYIFITNNSSKSVTDYVSKLQKMGIYAYKENFFTSTQATVLYLKQQYPNAVVYCQGTRSLIEELSRSGICVVEQVADNVGVILVGFDTELTSQKLRNTCQLLTRPLPFIATNPDLACPVSFGRVPDCGSICQMLQNATGRKPVYIGKPQPIMVDFVRNKYGYTTQQTAVIGDRLYTDIATGVAAGVASICVLTGEATVTDIQSSSIKPDYTFLDVGHIAYLLKSAKQ